MKYFFRVLAVGAIILSFLFAVFQEPLAAEVESYVLPTISIQYRGSFIMNETDLERAREDFPEFYPSVFEYEDLRASKLLVLPKEGEMTQEEIESSEAYEDIPQAYRYEAYLNSPSYMQYAKDGDWIAFYFPVYAIACLPMKLILQLFQFRQIYAFALTNAFLFSIAILWVLALAEKEEKKWYFYLTLLILSPFWYYIRFVSGEALIFFCVLAGSIFWQKKKYKRAVLAISIGSMINPTAMAIGIVLFLEYLFGEIKAHQFTLKRTVLLCCCYLPSLLPFIFNLATIGKLNATFGMIAGSEITDLNIVRVGDTTFSRMLAYLFDLDLGLAAISLLLVLAFFVSPILGVIKRRRAPIFYFCAALFTVFGYSLATHINSGMMTVARYVFWTYPLVVLTIFAALFDLEWKKIFTAVASGLVVVSILGTTIINGGEYEWMDHTVVSTYILDHYPELFWSPCNSTFCLRTAKLTDCYVLIEPIIYTDSKSDAVRKIFYYNDAENRDLLLHILEPDQNTDLSSLKTKLAGKKENTLCYLNINCHDADQYFVSDLYKAGYYRWIRKTAYQNYRSIGVEEAWNLADRICHADKTVAEDILQCVYPDNLTDWEYVSALYEDVLQRTPGFFEVYFRVVMNDVDREGYLWEFLTCQEYRKNRLDYDGGLIQLTEKSEEEDADSELDLAEEEELIPEEFAYYLNSAQRLEMEDILDEEEMEEFLEYMRDNSKVPAKK